MGTSCRSRFKAIEVKCSHRQGFAEKYRSKARMIFSQTALAAPTFPVEKNTELSLPAESG